MKETNKQRKIERKKGNKAKKKERIKRKKILFTASINEIK